MITRFIRSEFCIGIIVEKLFSTFLTFKFCILFRCVILYSYTVNATILFENHVIILLYWVRILLFWVYIIVCLLYWVRIIVCLRFIVLYTFYCIVLYYCTVLLYRFVCTRV
jgi:hypothetical protein